MIEIEGEHMQEWFESVGKKFVMAFVEGDRWKLGAAFAKAREKPSARCKSFSDKSAPAASR